MTLVQRGPWSWRDDHSPAVMGGTAVRDGFCGSLGQVQGGRVRTPAVGWVSGVGVGENGVEVFCAWVDGLNGSEYDSWGHLMSVSPLCHRSVS